VLILSKKGVRESDATGDGTGHSLTIRGNYESYAQELRDGTKGNDDDITDNDKREKGASKGRLFVHVRADGHRGQDVHGLCLKHEIGEG